MSNSVIKKRFKKVLFVTLAVIVGIVLVAPQSSTSVRAVENNVFSLQNEVQGRCISGAPAATFTVNVALANVYLTATATSPFTNLTRGTTVTAVSGTSVTNGRRFIRGNFGMTGWVNVNHLTAVPTC